MGGAARFPVFGAYNGTYAEGWAVPRGWNEGARACRWHDTPSSKAAASNQAIRMATSPTTAPTTIRSERYRAMAWLRRRKQSGRGKTILWKRPGPVKRLLATASGHQTLAESRWVSGTAAGRGPDAAVTTLSRVWDFGFGSADRIGKIGESPRSWHTARYSFTVV